MSLNRSVWIIGAMADGRVAGTGSGMPWYMPEDLARFKRITYGHAVIMGRRTWDSLPGPLRGRQNIVLSEEKIVSPGMTSATSLSDAIAKVNLPGPVFVIGGSSPWREGLAVASRIYLTRIHAVYHGTVLFPEIDTEEWREVSRDSVTSLVDGRECKCDFLVYERSLTDGA